jgi:hypothetical protein
VKAGQPKETPVCALPDCEYIVRSVVHRRYPGPPNTIEVMPGCRRLPRHVTGERRGYA